MSDKPELSDERLTAELQRRSRIAKTPDLLASIQRAIEQPRGSESRWNTGLAGVVGLAAIAIVVVVLATALPALGPGPSQMSSRLSTPATTAPAATITTPPGPIVPSAQPSTAVAHQCDDAPVPLSVLDSAQIVSSCAFIELDYHGAPYGATNPDDDQSQLEVVWGAGSCLAGASLTLNRDPSRDGYVVTIEVTTSPGCDWMPDAVGVVLALSEPVSARDVSVSNPSPAPVSSAVARGITCGRGVLVPGGTAASPDPNGSPLGAMVVQDWTGLVSQCWTEAPPVENPRSDMQAENVDGNLQHLTVWWRATICASLTQIEFGHELGGYQVRLTQINSGCGFGESTWKAVDLFFTSPVPASSVGLGLANQEAILFDCSLRSEYGFAESLMDASKMVTSCEGFSVEPFTPGQDAAVTNPGGGDQVLEVTWPSSSCSNHASLTFARIGDSDQYEVSITNEIPSQTCFGGYAYRGVTLRLTAGVPAQNVSVDMHRAN
jgi:hypothetical protein